MLRGYYFAKSILNKNFELVSNELVEKANIIKSIDISNRYDKLDEYAKEAMYLTSELRKELNDILNNKEITKVFSIEDQIILNSDLKNLFGSDIYLNKKSLLDIDNSEINKLLYDANENWVNYDN